MSVQDEVKKAIGSFFKTSEFKNRLSNVITHGRFIDKLEETLKEIIERVLASSEFNFVLQAFLNGRDEVFDLLLELFDKIAEEITKAFAANPELFKTLFGSLEDTFNERDVANAIKEFMTVENFLRARAEIFALLLGALFDVRNAGPANKLLKELLKFIINKAKDIFNLLDPLSYFEMPKAVSHGPKEAIDSLKDLGKFKSQVSISEHQEVLDRLGYVANSLNELVAVLSGANSEKDFIFGLVVDELTRKFESVYRGNAFELKDFIRELIDPSDVLEKIGSSLVDGNFWGWVELPNSSPAGALHAWINAPRNIDPTEREFRMTFIAAFDEYLRHRNSDDSQLADSDSRMSTGVIVDLVNLFFDTVIRFTLEPANFPLIDEDWDSFEDIGPELGEFVSRQVRSAVRTTIATALRGIWLWKLDNENLIEGISSIIACLFSAILDGVIRNLLWSVRVMSVYRKKVGSDWEPLGFSTGSLLKWEANTQLSQTPPQLKGSLGYVAIMRDTNQRGRSISLPGFVNDILKDYGGYLDVMYHTYVTRGGYRDALFGPQLHIRRSELRVKQLTVEAECRTPTGEPRTVVRVYISGQMHVMTPNLSNDTYRLQLTVTSPKRIKRIVALSSLGSAVARPVTRP